MAQVDASIISQIPDMAPNPVKATQDAYSLYDSKNRVQMNALTLQDAKENQADRLAAKKILQSSDLSNDKGVNDAAVKIQQVSPDLAMKFKQDMTQQKGVNLDVQAKQLENIQKQSLPLVAAIDGVIQDMEPIKKLYDQGKITEAELDAFAQKKILAASQQLMTNNPEVAPFLQKYTANPLNLKYSGLVAAERSTKEGREMAANRLKEIQAAQGQQRLDISERRADTSDRLAASLIARRDEQNKKDEQGQLTPETLNFIADQYIAGDRRVVTGLGYTKGAMVAARNAITARATSKGITGADLAAKLAQFDADTAEMRKIGNISGGVEFATGELRNFIPQVLDTSEKLPRGKFVPYNKAIQQWEKYTSDPKLRDFYVAMRGVMNAYDVLAARGGSDTAKREENRQMLATADSKEVVRTVLNRMQKEIEAAQKGGEEAKQNVAAGIVSRAGQKAKPAVTSDKGAATPPKTTDQATKKTSNPAGALSEDDQKLIDLYTQ